MDFIYIALLSAITVYLWHPLLQQVLQWEGYFYLTPDSVTPFLSHIDKYHTYFNVQGLLLGALLSQVFGINMKLYFTFEIAAILLTNIAFFYLAKTLIKNSYGAFLATVIFASNFFALADIHRPNLWGGMSLERLTFNIPLLFVSFIFLYEYLEQEGIRTYIISVVLFTFAIFLSHFSIFWAFPFSFYPIIFYIFKRSKLDDILRGIFLTIPYILITLFFYLSTQASGTSPLPKINFLEFLLHPQTSRYPEAIVRQLTYISQFPAVLKAIISGYQPLLYSTPIDLTPFVLPTIIFYLASFIFLFINKKKERPMLLTILLSTVTILFSNALISPRLSIFTSAETNRYFFLPSILISIYWSVFLISFKKKYIITIPFILIFLYVNSFAFSSHFRSVLASTDKTKRIDDIITKSVSKFPRNSVIVINQAADFGPYDADFFSYQIGRKRSITFEAKGYGDWVESASKSAHLIYLDFANSVSQNVVR